MFKFGYKFFLFQSVWVCILCRKKQELLGRTGQWMQGGMQAVMSDPETAMLASVMQSDKRPKLERAHSAAEKENQPLQRYYNRFCIPHSTLLTLQFIKDPAVLCAGSIQKNNPGRPPVTDTNITTRRTRGSTKES